MINLTGAKWIAPGETKNLPVLSKKFSLSLSVDHADVWFSGLGMCDLYINGKKAHDTWFEPGESVYQKTVYVNQIDVTKYLCTGENTVELYLGNGFYYNEDKMDGRLNRTPGILGPRKAIFSLSLSLEDGTNVKVISDESWRYAEGPLECAQWLGGEDRNGMFIPPTYETCPFVTVLPEIPEQCLREKTFAPIREVRRIYPLRCFQNLRGNTVVDFGENFAGGFYFQGSAERGTCVRFYPGEVLTEENFVDQRDFWGPIYDSYRFAGREIEHYQTEFVYHGFRYLEVEGIPVKKEQFYGFALHGDYVETGSMETDSSLLRGIHRIIHRSIEDNIQNVLTDCPHREKLGWTEAYHLLFSTLSYHFQLQTFYQKLVQDLMDAQMENGSIPSIVPSFTAGLEVHALREGTDVTPNDPTWCGALIFICWKYYKTYGEMALLEKAYPSMERYMGYLQSLSKDNLLYATSLNRELGDWFSADPASVSFAVSCTYLLLHQKMGEIAALLGKDNPYTEQAKEIRKAINACFFQNGQYDNGSQSACALALGAGLPQPEYHDEIVHQLVRRIQKENLQITTGEVALKQMLDALAENGYGALAFEMILKAYGRFVEEGKTTLPESWDGRFSQNHCMLGNGDAFFFEHLAGLKNCGVAYDQVEIAPLCPEGINCFSIGLKTVRGDFSIGWERYQDGALRLQITVPDGVEAVLFWQDKQYPLKLGQSVFHF